MRAGTAGDVSGRSEGIGRAHPGELAMMAGLGVVRASQRALAEEQAHSSTAGTIEPLPIAPIDSHSNHTQDPQTLKLAGPSATYLAIIKGKHVVNVRNCCGVRPPLYEATHQRHRF